MCGIYGFLNISGLSIDCSIFNKMEQLLRHRGPDDKGIFIDGENKTNCVLGHTRLSIVDLSDKAKQPMSNEDNSLYLVFNGEIYNYNKIRIDLLERGHVLKSNSDSEVILHLYEEKKEKLLEDLRGMFAFALYDKKRNRVLHLPKEGMFQQVNLEKTKNSWQRLTINGFSELISNEPVFTKMGDSWICLKKGDVIFGKILYQKDLEIKQDKISSF